MGKETWLPVVGYERLYEVSDKGNVRSVSHMTRDGRFWKGRPIGKHPSGKGYLVAVLSNDGVYRREYIHRLVAKAFLPNPEDKPEVNHIDGNKHNNSVSNLEWVTKSENGKHNYAVLGRKRSKPMLGKPSPNRKLTPDQVRAIREDTRYQRVIAKEYGVEQTTISAIKRRVKYKDVI